MDPPKVLVIDDEEIARVSCRRVLAREGMTVGLASSGREGLELLMREPHDLVLVDFKMADMDGVEVVRRIHAYDPSIVTVIITGYATVEGAVAAMKEGAYDYLPKPFTPDELLIAVRRGLEKRRLDLESRALREEKEAMERNFVTMVTHQLRSPLAAILQYFEVLLAGIGGDLSESQREMLQRAKDRLESLMALINDWLDMSRLSEENIVSRLQAVDLRACLDEALKGLEWAARQKNVSLHVEIPQDLPRIHADPDTFREVLSNLISNAIKYNRVGGRVTIRARGQNGSVQVEVEDTGVGIDEREVPFVFEQFYRAKDREVREQEGTGLGLAIVRKIVRAHGGTIQVVSRKGEGSIFRVVVHAA
ncbi:His Kinase A (phospho-acceptor) domain-containing protein [Desulfacinum hydrothermale DSM 13146]|uniref:histidine kinase n=1 Tax=Desulfacinum hydrothermale DSM 13146 TaxID=1121390 RepID=A0A1W1XN24_9BACT|nr:hybrid sensor histidine kinase/response regulator [Desulfacinum hydrothermale]SMC25264.1 His Kinase A (phospho-acceptor) domain-containing protein [Desulfacinum hydrothermale DSM 13146]